MQDKPGMDPTVLGYLGAALSGAIMGALITSLVWALLS